MPTLGSISAGLWRIIIMPVDTIKTCLQVYGSDGFEIVKKRVQTEGLSILYAGSIASSAATFVGHFPWFFTFNGLSSILLTPEELHTLANEYVTTGLSS